MRMSEKMKVISVKLPDKYIQMLDGLVEKKDYPSRDFAISTAIRNLLSEHQAIAKWMHNHTVEKYDLKQT